MLNFSFDNTYTNLPELFYSKVEPDRFDDVNLAVFNQALANELNLCQSDIKEEQKNQVAQQLSGQVKINKGAYIAQAYAGHQFGHPVMLGDGRAILLGEHTDQASKRVDVQLKGSGPTPYSRGGDGKASLVPMLREYLVSEAMHALNIPTSRSLAVVTTGESVVREEELPGAVLTRVAQSHLRVGTFEYAYAQKESNSLKELLQYSWNRHFSDLDVGDNLAESFLKAVVSKQVELMLHWMRVGFVHGVMNTDNMSIAGETIDYGPCAFMDSFNMSSVFSSIDRASRYAYGQQPHIAQWNLSVLAQCLVPLLADKNKEAMETGMKYVNAFLPTFEKAWLEMMRNKLGLQQKHDEDKDLVKDLLVWMQNNEVDYTYTFYCLSFDIFPSSAKEYDKIYQNEDFQLWFKRWQKRLEHEKAPFKEIQKLMRNHNPSIIPRNHLVQKALDEVHHNKDYALFFEALKVLENPYNYQNPSEKYLVPPSKDQQEYVTYCGT